MTCPRRMVCLEQVRQKRQQWKRAALCPRTARQRRPIPGPSRPNRGFRGQDVTLTKETAQVAHLGIRESPSNLRQLVTFPRWYTRYSSNGSTEVQNTEQIFCLGGLDAAGSGSGLCLGWWRIGGSNLEQDPLLQSPAGWQAWRWPCKCPDWALPCCTIVIQVQLALHVDGLVKP